MIKLFLLTLLTIPLLATSLKVAVAANARFAFEQIAKEYEKNHTTKIIPIVASSGKLTALITHGAPFDLFLSADMSYPEYLFTKNRATTKPKIYAYGTLVLWTLNKNITPTLKALKDKNIKKIAIPNPKTAPYGVEALKLLESHNLKESLYSKLVFGESVSQTSQYIYSRSADIGITAKSIVLSPRMKNQGSYISLNTNDYTPIKQGIVILKYGLENHKKESLEFYNFIFSPQSQKILRRYGYLLP